MKQAISSFRINLYMVAATICLHGAMMVANELFFRRAEFLQGIGWIYIPAGTRRCAPCCSVLPARWGC
jgi:hypothetical protein